MKALTFFIGMVLLAVGFFVLMSTDTGVLASGTATCAGDLTAEAMTSADGRDLREFCDELANRALIQWLFVSFGAALAAASFFVPGRKQRT